MSSAGPGRYAMVLVLALLVGFGMSFGWFGQVRFLLDAYHHGGF